MDIPLVDLGIQHERIADEMRQGFERVFKNTAFILGDDVARFERAYGEFAHVDHVVGVANGTDALELCLRAAGIGDGAEVLVPTNTFAATALAVIRAGARPVFVDCESRFHLIDMQDAERRLTSRSKAIMPVHLYGQMAPVEEIADFARSHDLVVIEDAAQVQGAVRNGETYPATLGLAAGTSFYPGKNLGAYGDAGAVLTNSDDIARAVRALRNYGSETKYQHDRIGFNSRLDSLQAVVLNVKLKYLVEWNEARRAAAQRYMDMLEDLQDVTLPEVMNGNEHIWHLFVVRVQERDRVLKAMNADGIGAGVHYPVPLHLQPAFAGSGHEKGDFPVAERLADEVLSLPLFPEISEEQQRRVVDALARALRR